MLLSQASVSLLAKSLNYPSPAPPKHRKSKIFRSEDYILIDTNALSVSIELLSVLSLSSSLVYYFDHFHKDNILRTKLRFINYSIGFKPAFKYSCLADGANCNLEVEIAINFEAMRNVLCWD